MNDLTKAVTFALDASDDPERDALNLFNYLRDRFRWSGTINTREDIESVVGRELTDDEFDAVADTRPWRRAGEVWNESGITWDTIEVALSDAGIAPSEDES